MDDDLYYQALSSRYGVRSCKELTRKQASDFIASLGRPMTAVPSHERNTKKRWPRNTQPDNVVSMVTPAQRKLIDALVDEINWSCKDGYISWRVNNLGIMNIKTSADAAKVIEGLKAIKRKQQLKVVDD